jgi:hypothetical protein
MRAEIGEVTRGLYDMRFLPVVQQVAARGIPTPQRVSGADNRQNAGTQLALMSLASIQEAVRQNRMQPAEAQQRTDQIMRSLLNVNQVDDAVAQAMNAGR